MCQKVPYSDKRAAKDDIKLIKNQHRHFTKRAGNHKKQGRKMSTYLCKACGFWHITTSSKRKY